MKFSNFEHIWSIVKKQPVSTLWGDERIILKRGQSFDCSLFYISSF